MLAAVDCFLVLVFSGFLVFLCGYDVIEEGCVLCKDRSRSSGFVGYEICLSSKNKNHGVRESSYRRSHSLLQNGYVPPPRLPCPLLANRGLSAKVHKILRVTVSARNA